jgi:hypothetical protein
MHIVETGAYEEDNCVGQQKLRVDDAPKNRKRPTDQKE